MTARPSFFDSPMYRAVMEAPDDAVVRMVWADWLDDSGEAGAAEVAALIRAQHDGAGDLRAAAEAATPFLLGRFVPPRVKGQGPWRWAVDEVLELSRDVTWTLYDGRDRPRADVYPRMGLPAVLIAPPDRIDRLCPALAAAYPLRSVRPLGAAPVTLSVFAGGYAEVLGWGARAAVYDLVHEFRRRTPRYYEWAGWAPYRPAFAAWVDDGPRPVARYNRALRTRLLMMGVVPVAVHDRLTPWPGPGGFGPGFYPTEYAATEALAAAVARWYTDGCPVTDPPAS